MSTSALISVEDLDGVYLYKHWDGYPEATLPWLEEFNKDFSKNRGDDPEYKFAQLVRSSERDGDKFELDRSKYTGWGVTTIKEYGVDYYYILKADGTVEVE